MTNNEYLGVVKDLSILNMSLEKKELFFCADVFRLSYLLRREHDGPHTDVLSASRSLEGKEVWAVT